MYSRSNSLVYRHEGRSTILSSEEGIYQGDPLGPFLFSVAIQDSLTELQKKHSEVIFLAYLDDVFILGQSDAILHALADLREALSSIGLVICDRKSEIYWPSQKGDQVLAENVNIPIRADGIVVLGVPIGNRDYVSNTCSEFTERGKQLCGQLLQLEDIQSAMLLLRYSHSHRLSHLLRTIPPDILWPAAFTHDLQTRSIFSRLLNVDAISDSAWEQAVLPVRSGGFGLTSACNTSPLAFLAGWAQSLHTLPNRFSELGPVVDSVLSESMSSSPTVDTISYNLQQSLNPGQVMTDLLFNTKKTTTPTLRKAI